VCKELLWSEQRVATRDFRPRDCPRTPTVKASLNPTWAQPVKTLGTVQGGICAVQQMQFFIVLWDEDSVSQDDELGCAVLPMNSVCDGKPHEFLLEVEKNGSNAGTICGTVQVRIVDMSQGPDKLTRYHLRNINTLIRTVD
jgi:Ca2+-dependent lipid-binding protein